jgi:hypothetical protein
MPAKIIPDEVFGFILERHLSGLISFSTQSNNRRLFNPYILYLNQPLVSYTYGTSLFGFKSIQIFQNKLAGNRENQLSSYAPPSGITS